MKKILFIALSLTILSLAVLPLSAEKRGKGDGHGKGGYEMGMHKPFMHFNKMQEKLGLTNDQVDKMYKIHKEYMERIYQNRNNADKVKELRDNRREDMASILTPEQKAQWDNFAKDRKTKKGKGKGDARGSHNGGHGFMSMMQKKLDLSDEQCDKIFKIHKDYMDRFYQNRNDESKIKELRAKQMSEIQNVLTPQQKAKWEERKKNRQTSYQIEW